MVILKKKHLRRLKMKKSIKKLMAALLSVILILVVAIPAFAAQSGDEIVARISVCSRVKEVPSLGHTWIYIHNISDEPIQVGAYTVPVGEGVSIGTFANTRDDGKGVYYNIESHCINKYGDHDFFSITKEISADTLNKVSNKILTLNNWNIFNNCMQFTFTVWQTATGQFFANLLFPAFGELQMRLAGARHRNLNMYYPSADRVYKQKGSGSGATLAVVRESSLKTPVG